MVGIAPPGATTGQITPLWRGVSIVGSYGASTRADLSQVIALAQAGAVDLRRAVTDATALTRPPRRTTP